MTSRGVDDGLKGQGGGNKERYNEEIERGEPDLRHLR
jgi:hypothetical protein